MFIIIALCAGVSVEERPEEASLKAQGGLLRDTAGLQEIEDMRA